MNTLNNQLFIEGENNQLFVYVYLQELTKRSASKILDHYVESFKNLDFEKIYVSFWSRGISGEHLSKFLKTSDKVIARMLKGIRHIETCFDFKKNLKVINRTRKIN
ncbi:MAG: hypothetical protein L0Y79_12625 [Chlorobi bacterium]|nr:hypothetical protein [Chlorobiota bacterium]MCI0715517.1 hypothetical protein [Chlorobiota bacterium]